MPSLNMLAGEEPYLRPYQASFMEPFGERFGKFGE